MYYKQDRYYHVRRGKWTPLGAQYVTAISKWAGMEGAVQGGYTVAHALEAYIADGEPRLSPATLRGYRNQERHINDVWGVVALEDVTRPEVREWLHAHKSVYAANRKLALLKAALNFAVEKGWLAENPAKGVRRLPGEQARRRVATRDELVKLGEAARPMWRAILSVELLTGMRTRDLRLLDQRNLTPDGIRITHNKTRHETLFQWTDGLRLAVNMAIDAQKVRSLYVFPTRAGGPYTADGFRTEWHKLRAAAGVEGLQFKDLRRTAATFQDDLEAARALLGHTDSRITSRVYRPIDIARPKA